jgi:hypothetical protein
MDITTILGICGMALILFAFLLNQMNVWQNNNIKYDFSNLIGSGLMVYYAFTLKSVPFFLLNLVWTLVSLKDVIIYFNNSK